MKPLAACLLVLLACIAPAAESGVRVEATRDNSIVLVGREWRINGGRLPHIRIKGNQHVVAMDFDRAPLRGRLVKSATLVARKGAADISGLTISTLMAPWDERKSNALTSGAGPGDGWGHASARFPAVTGGNAFSLLCQAPSVVKDGRYHWEVDPDLVHALAVGAAYGLTLHEWDADYSRNPTIASREQASARPYLLVELADGTAPAPQPPKELKMAGDADALRLTLRAPPRGFAYEVTVGGEPLGRWNTPFAQPGQRQVIPIRDLPLRAGASVHIEVVTVSRTGQRSAPATLDATVPAPPAISFPDVPDVTAAGAPPEGLAVIPLQDKYDAAGRPVGTLPPDHRRRNPVFDGKTIRLAAARGEVVGFQALVKGNGKVKVTCRMPGLRTDLWRAVYVQSEGGRRIPDPLLPLEDEVALSPGEATPVCVDVFVPFDFAEREVAGALTLSDGRALPVRLTVRPFAIPREVTFACEMNAYGLPDTVRDFYRLQEVAYDHRVHVNILAYGHRSTDPRSVKSSMNMLMADGHRMDQNRYNAVKAGDTKGYWDEFAKVFGPYLSGSHFKDGHRGPVPARGFYLTFHESWPLRVREFWSGRLDAYETFKARPEYARTFVAVLKDFLNVAKREGWQKTGFQVYLNNKTQRGDARRAPWTLDEPVGYWDYRALAYYGDLVHQATRAAPGTALEYRIDISRPQFDRGQLLGKCDLWVVSSAAFRTYPRLIGDRAERTGERIWVYGTSNRVEQTNRTIEAWALEAYRGGASGILPWQTVNKSGSAMTKADQLGLFIFAKGPDGSRPVRHSMRLAAYRSAQQTAEYLELLRRRRGLTPGRIRAFVDHYADLRGAVRRTHPEDAGTPHYDRVSPDALRRLREAAAELVERP